MESRRSARVATNFLVAIDGMDAEPMLRRGDISASGVYFETNHHVGEVGMVQWLHLASADRARKIHVMAYVVRTVNLADAGGGRVHGVAFEFMPENEDAVAALRSFVRYVLAMPHGADDARLASRLDASAEQGHAMVRQLSVRSMVLETSWQIAPGEPVRVEIVAPGMTRRIRLEGRAVRVFPRKTQSSQYAIEVEVQKESDRPLRHLSSMTMEAVKPDQPPPPEPRSRAPSVPDDEVSRTLEDLLSALILPPSKPAAKSRCHQLSGEIARVRPPTLLSLFDMERMSGRLVVHRGDDEATLYVSDGRILDVEPLRDAASARARVADVVQWEDGAFEFYAEPVHREDKLQTSTSALLIDLAREADEAKPR